MNRQTMSSMFSFFQSFKHRAQGEELMDDFALEGIELKQTLDVIEYINRWLGGNSVLIKGLSPIFQTSKTKKWRILDLGCGSGDGLRKLAQWLQKKSYQFELLGIDANAFTVAYAQEKAMHIPNIKFKQQDVFDDSCSFKDYDIVICGLFLHHLSTEDQKVFLQKCHQANIQYILINDLHRHWLAYCLFQLICFIFNVPKMVKYDGSLSIKKGFTKKELETLVQNSPYQVQQLSWRWAFRYQLIATA